MKQIGATYIRASQLQLLVFCRLACQCVGMRTESLNLESKNNRFFFISYLLKLSLQFCIPSKGPEEKKIFKGFLPYMGMATI